MLSSETGIFREPDDYETALQADHYSNLTVTRPGPFRAQLTRVTLHRSRLEGGGETLPRILFLSLPKTAILVSVPIGHGRPPVWGGLATSSEEIVIVGGGNRLHTRTPEMGRWGTVVLATDVLATYSRTILGDALTLPAELCAWRPTATARRELVRLHTAAMSVARTRLGLLTASEPAMGLEQEILDAVISCLGGGRPGQSQPGMQQHGNLMARFEDLLTAEPERAWTLEGLTKSLARPEAALDACCHATLGMGPVAYGALRRLELIRRALRRADPALVRVADVAARYGYGEAEPFESAFLASFGEAPLATLRSGSRP